MLYLKVDTNATVLLKMLIQMLLIYLSAPICLKVILLSVAAREGSVADGSSLSSEKKECRIANAIRVLSTLGLNLTVEVILETINLSSTLNIGIEEMLWSEFHVLVAE